jgi:hypothetical protein
MEKKGTPLEILIERRLRVGFFEPQESLRSSWGLAAYLAILLTSATILVIALSFRSPFLKLWLASTLWSL